MGHFTLEFPGLQHGLEYSARDFSRHFLVKGQDPKFSQALVSALVDNLSLSPNSKWVGAWWMSFCSKMKLRKKRTGSPGGPKYLDILKKVENDVLYSPSSIARTLVLNPAQRNRCRMALHSYLRYWEFPPAGDGTIQIKGQCPITAWWGWRWRFPYILEIGEDKVEI